MQIALKIFPIIFLLICANRNTVVTVTSWYLEVYEYACFIRYKIFLVMILEFIAGAAFGFAQAIPFFAYATTMLYGGYLVDVNQISYEDVFK